jgi:hypothetical protein
LTTMMTRSSTGCSSSAFSFWPEAQGRVIGQRPKLRAYS